MRNVIYGLEVRAFLNAWKEKEVQRSKIYPDCWESESLCRWQGKVYSAGYREAEVYKNIYGYALLNASGMSGFSAIRSAQSLGGSYDAAEKAALEWYLEDPSHRYVTTQEEIPDHAKANEPT